jgi:hypothetical protein
MMFKEDFTLLIYIEMVEYGFSLTIKMRGFDDL